MLMSYTFQVWWWRDHITREKRKLNLSKYHHEIRGRAARNITKIQIAIRDKEPHQLITIDRYES